MELHGILIEEMRMKLKTAPQTIFTSVLLASILLIQVSPAQRTPRRVQVTAKRYVFTPGEITLKKGEPVVLVLTSADVRHGIRFKEFAIEIKASKGETSELAFTPDKTGTFVGHCSVFCGTGHGSMTLTLHVVD